MHESWLDPAEVAVRLAPSAEHALLRIRAPGARACARPHTMDRRSERFCALTVHRRACSWGGHSPILVAELVAGFGEPEGSAVAPADPRDASSDPSPGAGRAPPPPPEEAVPPRTDDEGGCGDHAGQPHAPDASSAASRFALDVPSACLVVDSRAGIRAWLCAELRVLVLVARLRRL